MCQTLIWVVFGCSVLILVETIVSGVVSSVLDRTASSVDEQAIPEASLGLASCFDAVRRLQKAQFPPVDDRGAVVASEIPLSRN